MNIPTAESLPLHKIPHVYKSVIEKAMEAASEAMLNYKSVRGQPVMIVSRSQMAAMEAVATYRGCSIDSLPSIVAYGCGLKDSDEWQIWKTAYEKRKKGY